MLAPSSNGNEMKLKSDQAHTYDFENHEVNNYFRMKKLEE